jgi:hypothetical protein
VNHIDTIPRSIAIRKESLLIAVLAYGAASFTHHAHNATFLNEYPNLPLWLSSTGVYAAWCAVTVVGIVGLALVRGKYPLTGLAMLGLYGAYGLDGLAHYAVAPVSAHTSTMNLTIWLEVATAVLLLTTIAIFTLKLLKEQRRVISPARMR